MMQDGMQESMFKPRPFGVSYSQLLRKKKRRLTTLDDITSSAVWERVFTSRKRTVMQKACELETCTGSTVTVVIKSPAGEIWYYDSSNDRRDRLLKAGFIESKSVRVTPETLFSNVLVLQDSHGAEAQNDPPAAQMSHNATPQRSDVPLQQYVVSHETVSEQNKDKRPVVNVPPYNVPSTSSAVHTTAHKQNVQPQKHSTINTGVKSTPMKTATMTTSAASYATTKNMPANKHSTTATLMPKYAGQPSEKVDMQKQKSSPGGLVRTSTPARSSHCSNITFTRPPAFPPPPESERSIFAPIIGLSTPRKNSKNKESTTHTSTPRNALPKSSSFNNKPPASSVPSTAKKSTNLEESESSSEMSSSSSENSTSSSSSESDSDDESTSSSSSDDSSNAGHQPQKKAPIVATNVVHQPPKKLLHPSTTNPVPIQSVTTIETVYISSTDGPKLSSQTSKKKNNNKNAHTQKKPLKKKKIKTKRTPPAQNKLLRDIDVKIKDEPNEYDKVLNKNNSNINKEPMKKKSKTASDKDINNNGKKVGNKQSTTSSKPDSDTKKGGNVTLKRKADKKTSFGIRSQKQKKGKNGLKKKKKLNVDAPAPSGGSKKKVNQTGTDKTVKKNGNGNAKEGAKRLFYTEKKKKKLSKNTETLKPKKQPIHKEESSTESDSSTLTTSSNSSVIDNPDQTQQVQKPSLGTKLTSKKGKQKINKNQNEGKANKTNNLPKNGGDILPSGDDHNNEHVKRATRNQPFVVLDSNLNKRYTQSPPITPNKTPTQNQKESVKNKINAGVSRETPVKQETEETWFGQSTHHSSPTVSAQSWKKSATGKPIKSEQSSHDCSPTVSGKNWTKSTSSKPVKSEQTLGKKPKNQNAPGKGEPKNDTINKLPKPMDTEVKGCKVAPKNVSNRKRRATESLDNQKQETLKRDSFPRPFEDPATSGLFPRRRRYSDSRTQFRNHSRENSRSPHLHAQDGGHIPWKTSRFDTAFHPYDRGFEFPRNRSRTPESVHGDRVRDNWNRDRRSSVHDTPIRSRTPEPTFNTGHIPPTSLFSPIPGGYGHAWNSNFSRPYTNPNQFFPSERLSSHVNLNCVPPLFPNFRSRTPEPSLPDKNQGYRLRQRPPEYHRYNDKRFQNIPLKKTPTRNQPTLPNTKPSSGKSSTYNKFSMRGKSPKQYSHHTQRVPSPRNVKRTPVPSRKPLNNVTKLD